MIADIISFKKISYDRERNVVLWNDGRNFKIVSTILDVWYLFKYNYFSKSIFIWLSLKSLFSGMTQKFK